MQEDKEGFLYPEVNTSLCVDCGICEKVCPVINRGKEQNPLQVFAAKNKDEKIRIESSSGGIFSLLAEKIINEGGVVFGARFNENWEVIHDYTDSVDGLSAFRGSKYVQSRIGDTYRQAEKFLREGREVLFSGTPCQIKGLKLFLRKKYDNLLTVDLVCHGVPSPGIWKQYLDEIVRNPDRREGRGKNTVLPSSKDMPDISGISFRDKQLGWKKFSFVVRKKSAVKADKNSVLLSDIHHQNPFMKAFLANVILRPSCYECKAKDGTSGSDITIADFWGVQHIMPDFDDDKGVGLVLINTEKGIGTFRSLDVECGPVELEAAKRYNAGLNAHAFMHPKREEFFNIVDSVGVAGTVERILSVSIIRRMYIGFKRSVKKLLKRK